MPSYIIQVKGVAVKIVKSLQKVATYLNQNHANVRGISLRTLKTKLKNNDEYRIKLPGQIPSFIIIKKELPDSKKSTLVKEIKNKNFTRFRRRALRLNIKKTIVLNENTAMDIAQKIIDTLNNRSRGEQLNSFYQVIFIDSSLGSITSTRFENINSVRNSVLKKIIELARLYQDSIIDDIFIRIVQRAVPFRGQIVFGDSSKKNKKFLLDYLNNISNNDSYTSKYITEKTIKLMNKYNIISPETNKNCLYQAFFMAYHKKNNNKIIKKANNFIKYYGLEDKPREIKFVIDFLSNHFLTNVKVYDKNFNCYKIDKYEGGYIKIFVFGSHSYALVDKNIEIDNIKEDNEDVLIEPKDIRGKEKYKIYTYDLETCDSIDQKIKSNDVHCYAVGYYDGNNYKDFYECEYNNPIQSFIDYLLYNIKDNNVIIYAHNGGKFDTWIILRELIKSKGFVHNIIIKNGRIINLKYKFGNKNIFFRDSYTFLATSLDDLCRGFNSKTKKLVDDVNHDNININNCKTFDIKQYTKKYLKNDCICLHEILTSFNTIIKKHITDNLFGIKETLTNASIARTTFTNMYYDMNKFPLYNINKEYDAIIREYYYGGRNECLNKLGVMKGDMFYYDFTSLYPYVLLGLLPYGLHKEILIDNKEVTKIDEINEDWFGFVECECINIHKNKIPYHAYKKDHKLLFPYFDKYTKLIITTEELKYSLKNDLGYKYKINKIYHYEKRACYYKDMINKLYELKIKAELENNKPLRQAAKIIINSAYGFWGIKREHENIDIFRPKGLNKDDAVYSKLNNYLDSERLLDYKQEGPYHFFKYEDILDINCSNVAIAFFACAYARTHLYDLINNVHKKGGVVYYCDTDSIITNYCIEDDEELSKKYMTPEGLNNRLGDLTNESGKKKGSYHTLITLGNKLYYLQNEDSEIIKFKGLNIKKCYEKRIIQDNKIIYRGLKKKCIEKCDCPKICKEDYELMSEDYELVCETMTFNSGNEIIYKDKSVRKIVNDKKFVKQYFKSNIDEDILIPFDI